MTSFPFAEFECVHISNALHISINNAFQWRGEEDSYDSCVHRGQAGHTPASFHFEVIKVLAPFSNRRIMLLFSQVECELFHYNQVRE